MRLLTEEPERMAREKRLLEALARNESWFSVEGWLKDALGNLCLDFKLKLMGDAVMSAVLVYPPAFPDVPAYVFPKNKALRLTKHQFGGTGVFCLEWGADNWHNGITGVDLIHSTRNLVWSDLLNRIADMPALPSRETGFAGRRPRAEQSRFVVSMDFRKYLQDEFDGTIQLLNTRASSLGRSWVRFVCGVGIDAARVIRDVPSTGLQDLYNGAAWLVPVSAEDFRRPLETLDELHAILPDALRVTLAEGKKYSTIVVVNEQRDVRAFWFNEEPKFFQEYWLKDATREKSARLPESFVALTTASVAIVGLGSLGSKIAVSLARAGVRRFWLLDDDVFGQENLVRNGLSWRSVGQDKVEGVECDIKLVAPDAEVASFQFKVGGQANPSIGAWMAENLAGCQLVIDATASADAFISLAATCRRAKVPLVWAELFGGGIGALMARSRPGIDGDALAVRRHVLGVMSQMQPVPEHARAKREGYEVESDGQVFVGSDADVTVLAGHTTQFALDVLCAGADSAYPVSAYLIGFKKAWEFRQPFDTIPIDCSSAVAPAVERPLLSEEDQKAVSELLAAVKEADASNHAAT